MSQKSRAVVIFWPKYRLAHPENYLFSLSKNIFSGSKYPKKILFNFEKRSTGHVQVRTWCNAESLCFCFFELYSDAAGISSWCSSPLSNSQPRTVEQKTIALFTSSAASCSKTWARYTSFTFCGTKMYCCFNPVAVCRPSYARKTNASRSRLSLSVSRDSVMVAVNMRVCRVLGSTYSVNKV